MATKLRRKNTQALNGCADRLGESGAQIPNTSIKASDERKSLRIR